jgi:hypothetical protein
LPDTSTSSGLPGRQIIKGSSRITLKPTSHFNEASRVRFLIKPLGNGRHSCRNGGITLSQILWELASTPPNYNFMLSQQEGQIQKRSIGFHDSPPYAQSNTKAFSQQIVFAFASGKYTFVPHALRPVADLSGCVVVRDPLRLQICFNRPEPGPRASLPFSACDSMYSIGAEFPIRISRPA